MPPSRVLCPWYLRAQSPPLLAKTGVLKKQQFALLILLPWLLNVSISLSTYLPTGPTYLPTSLNVIPVLPTCFTLVQFSHSIVPDSLWPPWTAAHQGSLSITNSQSLLKLMYTESVMPSNHLILCHPLLPPSIFPSIGVFSNESVRRIRWPKYWSFSFSISPSNEHSELISFRMGWLDLLAVQGTLKSLL